METPDEGQQRDESQPNAALRMIGGVAAAPLVGLTKSISSLTGDIRTIAESVVTLPALLKELKGINEGVVSLDAEVKLMRQGVAEIQREVDGLPETISELEKTLHPLGRIAGRFRRGNGELSPEGEGDEPGDADAARPEA